MWLIMALENKNNNVRKRSENRACGYWAVGTQTTSNVSLEIHRIFYSLSHSLFQESPLHERVGVEMRDLNG
jgi:hypothetical protein